MQERLGATFGAASSVARRLSEDVGSSSGGISYEHKIEGGLLFFIVVISLGAGTYFLWVMRRIWANRARSAKVLDEIEMEFVNDIEDEELMATSQDAPDWGTIDERSRSPSTEAMTPSTPQSEIETPSR